MTEPQYLIQGTIYGINNVTYTNFSVLYPSDLNLSQR